jgi:hypothetical protein
MSFPQQKYPYFIFRLDEYGNVLKIHHLTESYFEDNKIFNKFFDLIHPSALQKALQFFNKIMTEGAALDWELSYNFKDSIEVMTTSGFKTDKSVYIIAIGRMMSTQTMYDEMLQINNEQLNSIRMLRKQLNQMALENNQIRLDLNKEIEHLRLELNKCKESLTA